MTETFYLRHVPQSEYRRLQERKEHKEKAYELDLDLKDLKIKDEELKRALIDVIKREGRTIVQSILPEDMWEEVIEGPCFAEILKKLGLS